MCVCVCEYVICGPFRGCGDIHEVYGLGGELSLGVVCEIRTGVVVGEWL